MDAQRLDGHKKVLGIIYIVSAAFSILVALLLNALFSLIFGFALDEVSGDERQVLLLVKSILAYLPSIVILCFALPTFIAGIGLLTKQTWALILSLIVGCLKLFSFPIGTAIGIYAIWIYSEDQKLSRPTSN